MPQNRHVPTVLIARPGGEGVVRREDGAVVVTWDVSADRGQSLRDGDVYLPVAMWLPVVCCREGTLFGPLACSQDEEDEAMREARIARD
jgi:hypothetical protein